MNSKKSRRDVPFAEARTESGSPAQDEREQLQEELRELREQFDTIFTRSAVAKAQIDVRNLRYVRVNPALCRYLGYSEEELLARNFGDMTHPEDRERDRAGFERLLGGEMAVDERDKRYIRADGAVVWAHVTVNLIRDAQGRPHRTTAVIQDVTERRRAEQALREANEQLREADRRKDEFLATLAHELRNPLAPIRTGVHILCMAGSESKAVLPMMERQLAHMTRLLDDLLDVSRITRGKIALRREWTELAAAIQAAVEANRPLIEQMKHRFEISLPSEPVMLEADPVRLAQIFSNLLNNAAKYTSTGGRIELRAVRSDGGVDVRVKDNGVGIPADQLESIFEIFSQIPSSASRTGGGLGIGLSLVKGLVALHGGRVEANSGGLGQGSEFVLWLPVSEQARAPGAAAMGEADRRTNLKILVVDDNRDAAQSLAMLLQMMGNEVRSAHEGEEAVRECLQFRPRVVLLDLGMPRMDGYEVCRRLREQPGGRAIAVIAVTGWGQEEDRRKSLAAGFDAHMVKPVDPARVAQFLQALEDRDRV